MRRLLHRRDQGGFSLVELVIVVLMLGIVTMSIYSLYQSTQRSTSTQDEVVEMQQNLRVAMDQIARDVRMAGFMIPSTFIPFEVAQDATFTINTATASARINDDPEVSVGAGSSTDLDLVVADASQAALFADDDYVRLIRPPNQNDLFTTCTIQLRSAPAGTTLPLTISNGGAAISNLQIRRGDIVARITNGSPNPNTIAYALNGTVLTRTASGSAAQGVADGFTGLVFSYLRDDGSEAAPITGDDRDNIKALRVTLTAQANVLNPQGGWETKTRSLSSVIALRNR
jgi:prepilin-type N-terminal cleavage/methylation domain-containing protein